MKKFLLRTVIVLVLLMLTILARCFEHQESINGTLIDGISGAPIANAFVAVRWSGSISSLVDSNNSCLHIAVVKTHDDGVFRIPAWTIFRWSLMWVNGNSIKRDRHIYKLGYNYVTDIPTSDGVVRVTPFLGTPQDRLTQLFSQRGFLCIEEGVNSKIEIPMLEAVLKEVRSLPGEPVPMATFGRSVNVAEQYKYEKCLLESVTSVSNLDETVIKKCLTEPDHLLPSDAQGPTGAPPNNFSSVE